jgi:hypothetical protein
MTCASMGPSERVATPVRRVFASPPVRWSGRLCDVIHTVGVVRRDAGADAVDPYGHMFSAYVLDPTLVIAITLLGTRVVSHEGSDRGVDKNAGQASRHTFEQATALFPAADRQRVLTKSIRARTDS